MGDEGKITFSKPVPIRGSVSISLDAQGDISPFYADGIVFYKSAANNGYEGDLEVALLPESFRTDVLGEKLDEKKVLIENADAKQAAFALLFEFDGDEKSIRHVLYNCTATPLPDGRIKAKTSDTTDEGTYTGWYDTVYETPTLVPGA